MFSGSVHWGFLGAAAEEWIRPRSLQFSCKAFAQQHVPGGPAFRGEFHLEWL
jgi:hypothetical protein